MVKAHIEQSPWSKKDSITVSPSYSQAYHIMGQHHTILSFPLGDGDRVGLTLRGRRAAAPGQPGRHHRRLCAGVGCDSNTMIPL
jgi:hypothetical protein